MCNYCGYYGTWINMTWMIENRHRLDLVCFMPGINTHLRMCAELFNEMEVTDLASWKSDAVKRQLQWICRAIGQFYNCRCVSSLIFDLVLRKWNRIWSLFSYTHAFCIPLHWRAGHAIKNSTWKEERWRRVHLCQISGWLCQKVHKSLFWHHFEAVDWK